MKVRETDSRQLSLSFDADEFDSFETCREFVASRVHQQLDALGRRRLHKSIAADMDLSPSHLTRKLTQSPDDSMRFTLDDLERFVRITGDLSPIYWLVDRHIADDRDSRIEALEAELAALRGAA
jgi:hypothetical protein